MPCCSACSRVQWSWWCTSLYKVLVKVALHHQYPVQLYLRYHVVLFVVECSDPGGVPHSTRSWSKWPYTPNTQFMYTCNRCYKGGGNITCQNNGEWTNKPNCTGKKPIFTFKRSASVAPEVNLKDPLHPGNETYSRGIQFGFETHGRQTSPEVPNRGISGPTKKTDDQNILKMNK